jgi:hypothetical protein
MAGSYPALCTFVPQTYQCQVSVMCHPQTRSRGAQVSRQQTEGWIEREMHIVLLVRRMTGHWSHLPSRFRDCKLECLWGPGLMTKRSTVRGWSKAHRPFQGIHGSSQQWLWAHRYRVSVYYFFKALCRPSKHICVPPVYKLCLRCLDLSYLYCCS